jgi:hypothetical protein
VNIIQMREIPFIFPCHITHVDKSRGKLGENYDLYNYTYTTRISDSIEGFGENSVRYLPCL